MAVHLLPPKHFHLGAVCAFSEWVGLRSACCQRCILTSCPAPTAWCTSCPGLGTHTAALSHPTPASQRPRKPPWAADLHSSQHPDTFRAGRQGLQEKRLTGPRPKLSPALGMSKRGSSETLVSSKRQRCYQGGEHISGRWGGQICPQLGRYQAPRGQRSHVP
jgi:hypothetical protein